MNQHQAILTRDCLGIRIELTEKKLVKMKNEQLELGQPYELEKFEDLVGEEHENYFHILQKM